MQKKFVKERSEYRMIQVKNISKIYNEKKRNEFQALSNVSLEIGNGEMIAIVGKSGAGKSTLLHILGLLDSPTSGEVMYRDISVSQMKKKEKIVFQREKIGFILQNFGLINEDSIMDNVCLSMMFGKEKYGEVCRKARKQIAKYGLEGREHEKVAVLSGGEKQRVAIARAMIREPDYIFADEPTGALDGQNAQALMEHLKEINAEGKTVVIVTHDMEIARQCNRMIRIADGKIVEQ